MLHLTRLLRTQKLAHGRIGLVRRDKRIRRWTGQGTHDRLLSPRSLGFGASIPPQRKPGLPVGRLGVGQYATPLSAMGRAPAKSASSLQGVRAYHTAP